MELNQRVMSALIELRQASTSIQKNVSHDAWLSLIEQYDILFLGERFNTIFCRELVHTLNETFQISIDIEELLTIIPEVCTTLGMRTQPLVRLEDAGKSAPPIAEYLIDLF